MPFVVGDPVEAYWEDHNGIGWWWKAIILKENNRSYRVRFDDYDNSWDMTLRKRFVRRQRQNVDISPNNADGDAMTISSSSDDDLSAEDTRSSDSNVSDHVSNSPSADIDSETSSDSDSDVNVTQESDLYTSRDQRIWRSSGNVHRQTPQRNVFRETEGPIGEARHISSASDAFHCFISTEMIKSIKDNTNRFANQQSETWKNLSDEEITAFLGILFLFGVYRGQHQPLRELLTEGPNEFRAAFGINRLEDIIRYLRFDDRSSRSNTRDKFSPFRLFWNDFINNCKRMYRPGCYMCVDEQLLPFRGRVSFRQYIPSKPDKYGMKIFLLVCQNSHYIFNAIPYCGRNETGTVHVGLASDIVKEICIPIYSSGRNITCDNYFTSADLAEHLSSKNLTLLGTMKQNRREIPPVLFEGSHPIGSSTFAFHENLTILNFRAKKKKNVVLLSTLHTDAEIDAESGKPTMVLDYNATKGSVDAVDQMCHTYSVQRKTRRWPLAQFYNCLNLAGINSFVIFCRRFPEFELGKSHRRRLFLKELGKSLLQPWLRIRAMTSGLHSEQLIALKNLGHFPNPQDVLTQSQPRMQSKRKRCAFCPYKNDKKTSEECNTCKKTVCRSHQHPISCVNCSV